MQHRSGVHDMPKLNRQLKVIDSIDDGSFSEKLDDFVEDITDDIELQHLMLIKIIKIQRENPDLGTPMLNSLKNKNLLKTSVPCILPYVTPLHWAILENQPLEIIKELKGFVSCDQQASIKDLFHDIEPAQAQQWKVKIAECRGIDLSLIDEQRLMACELAIFLDKPKQEVAEVLPTDARVILSLIRKLPLKSISKTETQHFVNSFFSIVQKEEFFQTLNTEIGYLLSNMALPIITFMEKSAYRILHNKVVYPIITRNKDKAKYRVFRNNSNHSSIRFGEESKALSIFFNNFTGEDDFAFCSLGDNIESLSLLALLDKKFRLTLPEIVSINDNFKLLKQGNMRTFLSYLFEEGYIDFLDLCFEHRILHKDSQIKFNENLMSPLALAMELRSMPLIETVLKYQEQINLSDLCYNDEKSLEQYQPHFDFLLNCDKTDEVLKSSIKNKMKELELEKEAAEIMERQRMTEVRLKAVAEDECRGVTEESKMNTIDKPPSMIRKFRRGVLQKLSKLCISGNNNEDSSLEKHRLTLMQKQMQTEVVSNPLNSNSPEMCISYRSNEENQATQPIITLPSQPEYDEKEEKEENEKPIASSPSRAQFIGFSSKRLATA